MAQPFSMRYCLVDGHGNFGSIDGDEAAAMRYTEARMTKMAQELVRDIDCETVDFVDNYDGSEKEPVVLPSRFPNLLVSGSSGIAVGMATNIPPHNLGEVIEGIKVVAANPDISVVELMETLKGPDFPTKGIILGRDGIKKAYETGAGSVVIRGRADIEETKEGKKRIVISELPYQVNKATLHEKIAALAREKVISEISNIKDESNSLGIRLVVDLKKDANPEVVLNNIYKHTQLQTSFGIIMLCLVNQEPKILPVKEVLTNYLNFQIEIVERRTKYKLEKDEERDHIVVGLLIAEDNIDEVVRIIKESESPDYAQAALMAQYNLSEKQTQAILSLTLRRLTGIEVNKLVEERATLEKNIAYYRDLLSSRDKLQNLVIEELDAIKNKYSDERKTEINNDSASIEDESLVPEEEIVVTLTENGYIKRLEPNEFNVQNRGGRGKTGAKTKANDNVSFILHAKTHTDLLFFTNYGRVYSLRGWRIPLYNRTAEGKPIINLINIEKDEKVLTIIACDEYQDTQYLLFFTQNGIIKRTPLSMYQQINRNGKIAIDLRDGADSLIRVILSNGNEEVGIGNSDGILIKFKEEEVRSVGRDSIGVKGMTLKPGQKVVGATINSAGKYILVISENGYGKLTPFDEYSTIHRGGKGVITLKVTEKTGKLVALKAVNGDEDLLVVSDTGIIIRVGIKDIRETGRNAQGVRIIRLDEGAKVASIAVLPKIEADLDETEEDVEGE
jgi:DNA gyrase subunit A